MSCGSVRNATTVSQNKTLKNDSSPEYYEIYELLINFITTLKGRGFFVCYVQFKNYRSALP